MTEENLTGRSHLRAACYGHGGRAPFGRCPTPRVIGKAPTWFHHPARREWPSDNLRLQIRTLRSSAQAVRCIMQELG